MECKTRRSRKLRRADLTNSVRSINVPGDYPWKVLHALARDIATVGCLRIDDAQLLDQIIRDRDVEALLTLDEVWGLQCIASFDDRLTIAEIRGRRLLAGLLKKFVFPGSKEDRRNSALETFYHAENLCQNFNYGGYKCLTVGEYLPKVITLARSFIRELLGDKPKWKELVEWSRFGPGSTLTTGRGPTSSFFKFARLPYTCTVDCYKYARFLVATDQRWMGSLLEVYRVRKKIPMHFPINMEDFWSWCITIVPGNRIDFVPKSARTERTIAIEPLLNLMLQLGVDGLIRRKLKRHDVDLDSQEKNQVMASLGSELHAYMRDMHYATIDLKAASDTVALKLVQMLFPEEWYQFLLALRSPVGFVPKHNEYFGPAVVNYEKLSSMGNGYTFAVESLIFTALTQAVIRLHSGTCNFKTDLAIFGDDIIVKERHVEKVIHVLQSCGFVVNSSKSFRFGIVKESCGTDWYDGHNVRPVSIDRLPETVMDLYVDHNRLQRILQLYFGFEIGSSAACAKIRSWIPPYFERFRGPISDTEFSTYLHGHPPAGGRGRKTGRWRYNRLVVKPVKFRVKRWVNFPFLKLCHDLSGRPIVKNPFELRGTSHGSRFIATMRKDKIAVSESCRPAYVEWPAQYADIVTGEQFRQDLKRKSKSLRKRLDNLLICNRVD